ncbi:hypothetical protein FRB91_011190 [Serendipita sp. 411]|nr:hypothetical protein FRB91_011190 [Serendipita sp. 411]
MRSQSSGQGVLISKTKHPKQHLSVYDLQMAQSVQTDVHDSFSTSSQPLTSSVAVDPSLGRASGALNTTGDSLQAGISNVGDVNGYGNSGTHSQHTPNILITPYSSNSYQRSSFPFVNANGNGHGHSVQDDDEAGAASHRADHHSPQSLAMGTSSFSVGDSPSPEPDSAEAQYRSVRLPPILQVEKQHVTTTATQAASATRRKNEAVFKCPVPGCGSTFTRRFNLRGGSILFKPAALVECSITSIFSCGEESHT